MIARQGMSRGEKEWKGPRHEGAHVIRKILLIEDNPRDVGLIEEMLKEIRNDYVLYTTDRISSALKLLDRETIDTILMDLALPDGNGIETLSIIQEKAQSIPVIVLTGAAQEELGMKMISLGAQDYLVKGRFDSHFLSSSLLYSFEHKRIEVELKRAGKKTELILESAGEGIFGIDANGHNTFLNKKAAEILGYAPNELIGKEGHFLYHHSRPDGSRYPVQDCPVSAAYRDGTRHSGEDTYWRKDGSPVPIEFTSSPVIENNRITGAVVTFRDISERKQAEATRAYLSAIVESTNVAIISLTKDLNGIVRTWNRGAEQVYGYRADEIIGRHISLLVPPDHRNDVEEVLQKIRKGEAVKGHETVRMRKDGTRIHVSLDVSPIREPGGTVIGASTIAHDITGRKRAEDRLKIAKELSDAVNRINSIIFSTHNLDEIMERVIVEAAKAAGGDSSAVYVPEGNHWAARYVYGFPEQLRDKKFSDEEIKYSVSAIRERRVVMSNNIREDREMCGIYIAEYGAQALIDAPLVIEDEVIGNLSVYSCRTGVIFNEHHVDFIKKVSASVALAVKNARLFEERRRLEEEMRLIAHHDPLTGLPNRRLFTEIINVELREMRRHKKMLALLFLDLDRFKQINDTLGHTIGDKLLREAAIRLMAATRDSDTVARIGGDEFNVILPGIGRPEHASDVAGKILSLFKKPFVIDGREIHTSTSIGISVFPNDGSDAETLFRYADIAMYHAKDTGRNTYRFYNAAINTRSLERMRFENALRGAIEHDELELYYQPVVDLSSGAVTSTEALLRWLHPERGLLLPKDFFNSAEDIGLMPDLEEWVLRKVGAQIRVWRDQKIPLPRITINLSARQFERTDLADRISSMIREAGDDPRSLDIEITETTAMGNIENSIRQIEELGHLGVGVSIDDFGMGYSSLNQLKRLPLRKLKIDSSFIRNAGTDFRDRKIIRAMLHLAHSLDLKAVAEGVENENQHHLLRILHCDEAQGRLFSEPMPAVEFGDLIAHGGLTRKT